MSFNEAMFEDQCWRTRNTFLEFYEEKDNEFSDLAPATRHRSASAGPLTTPTARAAMMLKRNEFEQINEARSSYQERLQWSSCQVSQDPFSMQQDLDKSGRQVQQQQQPQQQQEGYVAKRGGGLRGPYHAVEEAHREVKGKVDDAVVLSLANLTAPPSESTLPMPSMTSTERPISTDDVGKGKQKNAIAPQEATDLVGGENVMSTPDGGMTTAMIRHIACRYTQDDIAPFLNEAGFAGKYNWIYLPLNPQKTANLGYVFVNFVSQQNLDECRDLLDNQVFGPSQTTKRCQVSVALLQGPRVQRRSRRRGKDKNQQAALAIANGEAERQSCPRGSMDSCDIAASTHDTSDAHLVVGA
jgi:hypothetical protein